MNCVILNILLLLCVLQTYADHSEVWEHEASFPYNTQQATDLNSILYPPIQDDIVVRTEFENYRRLAESSNLIESNVDQRALAEGDPTSQPSSAPTDVRIIQVSDDVVCVACKDLEYCQILNGYMVQEVYYPDNPEFLGTCKVIESLAERLDGEIFGVGRTFRDTPQCRSIVMQYLCLFWGSNNTMYDNGCNALDEVNRPLKNKQINTQTPPCRSFCVQIAEVCANDYNGFLNVCFNIQCPPTETQCTPDPYIGAQVVSAGIGCSMPFDSDPYATNAGPSLRNMNSIMLSLLVLCATFLVYLSI